MRLPWSVFRCVDSVVSRQKITLEVGAVGGKVEGRSMKGRNEVGVLSSIPFSFCVSCVISHSVAHIL